MFLSESFGAAIFDEVPDALLVARIVPERHAGDPSIEARGGDGELIAVTGLEVGLSCSGHIRPPFDAGKDYPCTILLSIKTATLVMLRGLIG